jgi:hypothetical protein
MHATPRQQIVIALIFVPLGILSFHLTEASTQALAQREAVLQHALDDIKSLKGIMRELDNNITLAEECKESNLYNGRKLYAEKLAMIEKLPYSEVPQAARLGIQMRDADLMQMLQELEKIKSQIQEAKAQKIEGTPLLEQKIEGIRSQYGFDSPYKDAEINKQEGRVEFWTQGIVISVLILCAFVAPFRYLAYFLFGIVLIKAITKQRG